MTSRPPVSPASGTTPWMRHRPGACFTSATRSARAGSSVISRPHGSGCSTSTNPSYEPALPMGSTPAARVTAEQRSPIPDTRARLPSGAMRYADGPSTEASIDIAAPPAAVWALVSDIQLPARFSTEFKEARWLDDEHRRFSGRNSHPAIGEWETVSVIVEQEPVRVFAWAVTDA